MNNPTLELLTEQAEQHISTSLARVSTSAAPSVHRIAGEIDMAYKLKLIDYPRRDFLLGELHQAVDARRTQLRQLHNDNQKGVA